ncbi:hypothetical protein BDN72DRAFT_841645 [Pluteus cervinus]|uniref:Uncharacterized protein n=1 Tax=Pluteus cervinus TaxID=181527 RepID=A0ACD3ASL1_9AGAR|nr:hypothetical protein BDN72DRAFT_841645 [Pluteus cervinus]
MAIPDLTLSSLRNRFEGTSTLFGTQKTAKSSIGATSGVSPSPRQGLGYLAFGSGHVGISPRRQAFTFTSGFIPNDTSGGFKASHPPLDHAKTAERERRNAEIEEHERRAREQRLAHIQEEARKGEEDWVRSGGILRDADGRRDMVRTEAIRAELKLREYEKVLVQRWERYERRWGELYPSFKGKEISNAPALPPLRFVDIPWPVDLGDDKREVELGDITPARVEQFLLEGLKVRGCKVTKKERVRNSFLRWHPDKMTGLLLRVVPEDVDDVHRGINTVILCLQKLKAELNIHV